MTRHRRIRTAHLSDFRRVRWGFQRHGRVGLLGRYWLLLVAVATGGAVLLSGAVVTQAAAPGVARSARNAQRAHRRTSVAESRRRRLAAINAHARIAPQLAEIRMGPKARRERLVSRHAYHDIGSPAARRLLSADYGEVLSGMSANPAAMIASHGKVVRYLNDYEAQVRTASGLEVEVSTVPLRVEAGSGRKLPVDLSLEPGTDAIEPKRSLRPTAIGNRSSEGVSLTVADVSLTMLGINSPATLVGDNAVVYGDVAEDTDAVAVPKIDGVDLSALLRSVSSPTRLRYRVGLPLGASLSAHGGGAVVRRGSSVISRIPPPSAQDAQGTLVPVRMRVRAEELVVEVAHRERSYAYPILVDPEMLEESTETSEVWEYSGDTWFKWSPGSELKYEGGPFSHNGPGAGAPLSLTNEAGVLPFEVPSEYTPEGKEGLQATKFVSQQKWSPNPVNFISRIYVDGISASGASGPNIYSQFEIEACNRVLTWGAPEAAPTSYVFTPLSFFFNCNAWSVPGSGLNPSDVRVRATTGTTLEWEAEGEPPHHLIPGEQVTVGPATISVAAIVIARPLSWGEEEEIDIINSDTYGNGNPAQLSNTDCMHGDPVNCATGNLVETQNDLSVGGIGPELGVTRTYNSQLAAIQEAMSGFGTGWVGSYEGSIETEERCIAYCGEIIESIASRSEEEGEEGEPKGPIAAYSFDENEGETAGDSAGGHEGTVYGAEWVPGKFGPALRFSGNESIVTVPSSPDLELGEGFTLEAWVRPVKSHHAVPVITKETPKYFAYALESRGILTNAPEGLIFPEGWTEDSVNGSKELPAKTWSHLALTFDGESLRLYVNGVLVGSAPASKPQGGEGPLLFGATERFNNSFKGKIDEIRLYDRALDAEEIEADESTPIGTMEGSEELEEEEPEEGSEVWEETAVVHQYNGSTAQFSRIQGETSWTATDPLNRAKLVDEAEGFAYTLPDQTVLHLDYSSGLVTSEEDRNGNVLTVKRDGEGRISSVRDGSGRELVYTYDPEGFVKSIEDPMGHVVHYDYQDDNLVAVSQVDSLKPRWQFSYDHGHKLTRVTNARGGVSRTKYHSFKVVEQEDPMGHLTHWSYSPGEGESTTTITDPNGAEVVEEFNESGLVSSVTKAVGTSLEATTVFEYNGANELVAVTNPEEQTTTFGYDMNGNRTSERDPEGSETTWTFNGAHQVVSETRPSGEETTISRDADGNPESVSRPVGEEEQITSFQYGPRGELEDLTDPLGNLWSYEYDEHGDLEAEIDPEGDKRSWGYDEDSRMTSAVSPRGYAPGAEAAEFSAVIERDPSGRPQKIVDAVGGATEYAYDANGNLESVIDPNGNETRYTYDANDELTKVERPNGASEETGYDDEGQVISQTDGNEGVTTYVRDLLERPVETIDPLERATRRTFSAAGRLEAKEDPDGRTTGYGYDNAGRLREVSYSDGVTPTATFAYDENGNLTSMVDGTGESSYEYDQLDRLVYSKDGNGDAVSWEYDLANEPIAMTYPNGKAISRLYDKAGRLESITDWLGHTTAFGYDVASELEETRFPTGTENVDDYAFDHAGRMSGVTMKQGAETLVSLTYVRDKAGQIKSQVSKGLPGAEEDSFTYDENGRLKAAGADEFEYDDANNPTQAPGTTNVFDIGSQLESETGATFAYDDEGDRIERMPSSGPSTTYEYDQEGNLTYVERDEEGESQGIAESFAYNGLGLLTARTVGAGTKHLTWDPVTSPAAVIADGDSSFIYGPNGLPIEQISSEEGPTYLHHDQLGSTRMLTNAGGESAATVTYGPYGTISGRTGSQTTPLGYAGQYTLSESGLQYLRARMYDPSTAQFLTRDPLTFSTLTPYAYTRDNPVNGVDPLGLCNLDPLSESFWTEGNCISESPFNPIPYYAEEIESYENGCGYWSSVVHGLEGAAVATTDVAGLGGIAKGARILSEVGPTIDEANASHIFRNAPGHLLEGSAENRAILENAVKPGNYAYTDANGVDMYRELLPNGKQVWAEVYNGKITNGGLNETPR